MQAILILFLVLLAGPARAQDLDVGGAAPEIEAKQWLNWIGDGPNLRSLRGRPVLVHFFTTKNPGRANWLGLTQFHREHRDLVVLAVTEDSAADVEAMLRDYSLAFPIGCETEMKRAWGVRSPYAQILLDKDGVVFFRTDTNNGLWNGKLLKGMKGALRMGDEAMLVLVPPGEYDRRFKRVLDPLAAGDLEKGLRALDDLRNSSSTSEEDQVTVDELEKLTLAHVEHLQAQVETELARGEVLLAHAALEALVKNLKRHALGERPSARLSELEADEDFQRQLSAAEDYERAKEQFFRLGWEKTVARFQAVVDTYPGTPAADRAYNWVQRRY